MKLCERIEYWNQFEVLSNIKILRSYWVKNKSIVCGFRFAILLTSNVAASGKLYLYNQTISSVIMKAKFCWWWKSSEKDSYSTRDVNSVFLSPQTGPAEHFSSTFGINLICGWIEQGNMLLQYHQKPLGGAAAWILKIEFDCCNTILSQGEVVLLCLISLSFSHSNYPPIPQLLIQENFLIFPVLGKQAQIFEFTSWHTARSQTGEFHSPNLGFFEHCPDWQCGISR